MTSASTSIPHGHQSRGLTQVLVALLVVLAVAVILLAADRRGGTSSSDTSEGSGVAMTQMRNLASFTGVDLAGTNNVAVHVGDTQRVVVRADDNLIGLVTTRVRDGELVIAEMGSFRTKTPMSVDVTVPRLDSAALSGSGIVTIDGVDADQFTVAVPGSGVLSVSGTTERLDASLRGSGDVQLQDLAARDVKASVGGSGRLQVQATQSLDLSVSGSGAIFYGGNPAKVTQNVTGTGAIVRQ